MRAHKGELASAQTHSHPDTPRIAVVVPCHNEAGSIARVIESFQSRLPDAELVVVDNASSDATAEEARQAGARVVKGRKARGSRV